VVKSRGLGMWVCEARGHREMLGLVLRMTASAPLVQSVLQRVAVCCRVRCGVFSVLQSTDDRKYPSATE